MPRTQIESLVFPILLVVVGADYGRWQYGSISWKLSTNVSVPTSLSTNVSIPTSVQIIVDR